MAARSSAAAWRSAAPALCVPTARPSVPARRAHRQLRHQDDRDDRRDRSNRRSAPAWHRSNEASRRLATIPGVSSLTASAIVATVANATEFKSARHFAAFLGLTPKQCSTGGLRRLGRISKQGDVYIRRLLILGGTSLVRYARGAGGSIWAKQLLARCPTRIVTVALANKAAASSGRFSREERFIARRSRRPPDRALAASATPKGRAKEVMDRQSDRLPGQTRCEGMRIKREPNGSFGRRTIHQGQRHLPREQAGHKPATGMTVPSHQRP